MTANGFDRQQLDTVRRTLDAQRRDLENQLQAGGEAARPVTLDQQSVGRVSRVDAIQQQQMALAGREQIEVLLRQVIAALRRLDDGSYGYCQHCEEPIAAARLTAQPHAGLCLECQSSTERQ